MSKTFNDMVSVDWWEDVEKINEFKQRVVGMRVIYTGRNTTGSTGVIRDFIVQFFPSRRSSKLIVLPSRRIPTLIVDFPDTPYKRFALWNVKPADGTVNRAIDD